MEERILSAAEKLFIRNGYPATSTTEIAREAGCNQALVHYYFRTKEKLFNTVLEGKVKRAFTALFSVEAGSGNFEEKLTRMIETHYDIVRENSNMVLFLINGLVRDPELFGKLATGIKNVSSQALEIFQQELAAEVESGRIRPIKVEQLVLNIISMNVFVFAIKTPFMKIWGMDDNDMERMLDQRRSETVKTILTSLRP